MPNMAFIRTKKIKGKEYYYLVKGIREKNGKVRQKVIAYLGSKKELEKFIENAKKKLND